MRLPVRGDRADVPPVALQRVRAGQAVAGLRGQQLAAEVLEPVLPGVGRQRLEPVQRRPRA